MAAENSQFSVPLAPFIPANPQINVYRRFINRFEPDEYETGWADESLSGKTDVFLGDWSQLIKIQVRGPEAQAFFEFISTNRWPSFRPGQAKQAVYCSDEGLVVGDGLVLCVAENDFIFTDGPGTAWATFQFCRGRRKFNATLRNVSDEIGVLQVQGPKSVLLLDDLTGGGIVRTIEFNCWKKATLFGSDVRILRNGISGEIGFEIWADRKDCALIWQRVLQHGQKHNIRQLGGRAKVVHHAEAAFGTPMLDYVPACHSENKELGEYRNFLRSIGIDVDNYWARVTGSYSKDAKKLQLNPYELGWGWLVNFNHDFIGKAALLKIKQSGPSKQVSFVWNKEDVIDVFASFFRDETYEQMELPRANGGGLVASTVQKDGQTIGFATSRCYSSYFKVMLSLGVISPEHSKPGNEVEIVWGEEGRPQKIIRATVHSAPYKEDRRRTPLL